MRIGFLGAGHIARALAEGWHGHSAGVAPTLTFYDPEGARAASLARDVGGAVAGSELELVGGADLVVVAVRPPDVEPLLLRIGTGLGERSLVSLAAGVPVARLQAALPAAAACGRVMPNVAAQLGLGVFLVVAGSLGPRIEEVTAVLAAIGTPVLVDEEVFDVATAIAGCMPGFVARLAEAFAAAGVAGGLDPATSRRLAMAALRGAAAVVAEAGDPERVKQAAATPGGMTAAGLAALDERDMAGAVAAAVAAAAARAKELA